MTVNQNLKNALADAGLSIEEFAAILAVDPKSVGRWIAGTSTPYPRHRAAISRALALDETVLWPERAPTPAAVNLEDSPHGAPVPVGQVTAWADSSDPSAPDPVAFIIAANGPIDILSDDIWFELFGPISGALIARAVAGHPVRVASTAPRPDLAPLIQQADIELRCVDAGDVDVVHAGTTMLIATRLGGYIDQPIVLLQVEADGADGLYDRIAAYFGKAWNQPDEIITDVGQLEEYRTNAYDELEGELDDDVDPFEPDAEDRQSPKSRATETPDQTFPSPSTRRWPGGRG